MDMHQALANMIKSNVKGRAFGTGSKGFHGTGKITVDGIRYQAQAQAILVGSKHDPAAMVEAATDEIGIVLADLVNGALAAKTFSSGRTGFLAVGKVEARGQKFQANVQAVRLG